ncbi:MAG: hypothetical protein JRC68_06845 [Deltaproteobacteria bacterium]|nr:hypothetical protein [Deltaproteobacteria bacterium]
MDEKNILSQLEELARSLDIEVRYEQIKKEGTFYAGGLCQLKGEDILIVNSKATVSDQIQALAGALKSFNLSQVYMRPALREFLLKYTG